MSQELIAISGQLPAHLAKVAKTKAEELNRSALGGVGAGESVNRISLKQSRFRLIQGGEEVGVIQESKMDVVILRTNDGVSKTYYAKSYAPGQEPEAPDCYSEDGIRPDASVSKPVCSNCTECPMNKFGSKINPITGKESKACTDVKRLAVVPASDLEFAPHQLNVPAASLKDFGRYVRSLARLDPPIPYNMVVTEISFDTNAEFPKLLFKAKRYLTVDEYAKAEELFDNDEVKRCVGMGGFSMAAQAEAEAAAHVPEGEPPVAATEEKSAAKAKKSPAPEPEPEQEEVVVAGFGATAPSNTAAKAATQPVSEPPGEVAEVFAGDLDSVFGEGWDDD